MIPSSFLFGIGKIELGLATVDDKHALRACISAGSASKEMNYSDDLFHRWREGLLNFLDVIE